MMNVPRLERLEELLQNFYLNCSPTEQEEEAIAVLMRATTSRIIKAKAAGRSDHDR